MGAKRSANHLIQNRGRTISAQWPGRWSVRSYHYLGCAFAIKKLANQGELFFGEGLLKRKPIVVIHAFRAAGVIPIPLIV